MPNSVWAQDVQWGTADPPADVIPRWCYGKRDSCFVMFPLEDFLQIGYLLNQGLSLRDGIRHMGIGKVKWHCQKEGLRCCTNFLTGVQENQPQSVFDGVIVIVLFVWLKTRMHSQRWLLERLSSCYLFSELAQREASEKNMRCAGTCGFLPNGVQTSVEFAPCFWEESSSPLGNEGFCFLHGPGSLVAVLIARNRGRVHVGDAVFLLDSQRSAWSAP